MEANFFCKHHRPEVGDNQCSSSLTKRIKAPIDIVWSLVRRFDEPQKYKPFISECNVSRDFKVGTLREVNVKTGLPATTSTERLEVLDDDERVLGVKIIGGDHRLRIPFEIFEQDMQDSESDRLDESRNYSSTITVHPETIDGRPGTLLVETFTVDVPEGNTREETCYFIQALISCNLNCLAEVSEKIAAAQNSGKSNAN